MKNRIYLTPDWPAPKFVRAFTSTRAGGYSQAPYDSFNLGDYVHDDSEQVAWNTQALRQDLDLPETPRWLSQVHGNCAVIADQIQEKPEADASFTRQKNCVCAVLTADCLPVLLCHRDGLEVAAIHAGWKGLQVNVIAATINKMHSSPDDLMAWLGPALGPEHFELGDEVYADFLNANPDYMHGFHQKNHRWYLDCYAIAKIQLQKAGVTAIYGGNFCTQTNNKLFYSYRRDRGITGRMASLIFMT